jgi:hypothetical protein
MNDDKLSEYSNLNDNSYLMTSKNANEPITSGPICRQISPIIQMSSFTSNHEQHFKNELSTCNSNGNNEQSKWRSPISKYYIESLLQ